jgi:hypothetical protein
MNSGATFALFAHGEAARPARAVNTARRRALSEPCLRHGEGVTRHPGTGAVQQLWLL